MIRNLRSATLAAMLLAGATNAEAGSLSVGKWTTEDSCRYIVTEWEREVGVAAGSSQSAGTVTRTPYGTSAARQSSSESSSAYLREWGTILNEICTQNFPRIRTTMASALASNGSVNPGDGTYSVDGFLTDFGYENNSYDSDSTSEANDNILVSVSYQVRDAKGNIVYGGALTKSFNVSTMMQTGNATFQKSQSGRTVFSQLQEELGYAVARQILFHFEPLRVVANDGRAVAFNYGPPLIPMGAAIMVSGERSLMPTRLVVTGALPGRAVAQSPVMASVADVTIGSAAFFAEEEDPYADQSSIPSVELP
ncbi:hypothetical protein [Erythrobacter sp. BLCC-B19]|uniref:hypothetical protein n=1 Tax=Erythrobacter sp. BLCC-B19 TaxID=3025315 RepID=UPI00235E50DC|nr:hypothetical protein [Erythrobacter sp. BLCC-B19]WDA41738.1 hypothetical protein PS060_02735 [Erythrobacter sp. BLCC-B19]